MSNLPKDSQESRAARANALLAALKTSHEGPIQPTPTRGALSNPAQPPNLSSTSGAGALSESVTKEARAKELVSSAKHNFFDPPKENARIPDPALITKFPAKVSANLFRQAVLAGVLVWRSTGVQPTATQVRIHLKAKWTTQSIERVMRTDEYALEMNRCGIPWNTDLAVLSSRQMMALMEVANPTNTTPLTSKLKRMGIESKEWITWKKNPIFQQKLAQLTFDLNTQYRPEIDAIVAARALEGNLSYIQYMDNREKALESETSPAAFNAKVRQFLSAVFEAISTELSDQPELLARVAARLSAIESERRAVN